MECRPLKIIPGGRWDGARFGSVRVVAAPQSSPPFTVRVRVREEDTWLISMPTPVLNEPTEPTLRLMTKLIEQKPVTPGSVLMMDGKWLAIVHDFDRQPHCHTDWVEHALQAIFHQAESQHISSLALPLLGSAHSGLTWQHCLDLIIGLLNATEHHDLKRIWLQVPNDLLVGINSKLADRCGASTVRTTH